MDYEVLYEVSGSGYFPIISFIFLCLFLVLLIYLFVTWKGDTKISNIVGRILLCLGIGGLLLGGIGLIIGYIETRFIYPTYINGESEVAEGIVEDYEEGRNDHFTVDGVEFCTSSTTGYGNILRRADGGVLRNGMQCKIYYVPYQWENVIMKILIVPMEDCTE